MNGYRLVRRELALAPPAPPALDEAQRRVVDHKGGPLLVLAGPARARPRRSSRRSRSGSSGAASTPAASWCSRSAGRRRANCATASPRRLGRTTSEPLALTFHSYAYALVRREFVLAGDQPPRLLSAPEQLLEIRRMLRGEITDGGRELAGPAAARAGHQGLRRGAARRPDAGGGARARRQGAAPARPHGPGATTGWRPARSSTATRRASTWRRCPPMTTRRSSGSPRAC